MTPQPQYICTEENVCLIEDDFPFTAKEIRTRPVHPTAPQFNSTELLLLAHDEWKRRQERKHLNDESAWVSGFIGGFITDKTWAMNKIQSLRTTQEQTP